MIQMTLEENIPLSGVKAKIVEALGKAGRPLAVHEFEFVGISENSLASRLSELAHVGVVVGETRTGRKFKEWKLTGKI